MYKVTYVKDDLDTFIDFCESLDLVIDSIKFFRDLYDDKFKIIIENLEREENL